MRITRPRDWDFMSDKEKQDWAEKTGKAITEANKKMAEIMKEMRENPPKTTGEIKIINENAQNRIRWFNGGKF